MNGFIDGSCSSLYGVFHLLKGYLSSLRIQNFDNKILSVADGRTLDLESNPWTDQRIGFGFGGVYEFFDFFHAVGHWGTIKEDLVI